MIRKHFSRLESWRSRLNFAIKYGVTEEEQHFMESRQYWSCCAVGENRRILEQKGYWFDIFSDAPYNDDINNLGKDFTCCVTRGRYRKALKILNKIENFPTRSKVEM